MERTIFGGFRNGVFTLTITPALVVLFRVVWVGLDVTFEAAFCWVFSFIVFGSLLYLFGQGNSFLGGSVVPGCAFCLYPFGYA